MEPIADDIWHVAAGKDLRMPGGVMLPLRATIIRMPDGSVLVYSPIDFDDAAARDIDMIGKVAHIVAPSLIHHLYVASAAARWPTATVYGVPGLAEKRPDLRIDRSLATQPDAWRDTLELELFGGVPRLNEVVIFHRPSGTLACADFVFHVTAPANLRSRIVYALMGTGGGKLAQSRFWSMQVKDKAATVASTARVLAWPIKRVAPCHGPAVTIDAAGLAACLRVK